MKRTSRAVVSSLVLCCTAAIAQTPTAPAPFKSICITDKEVGYNWKAGEWVPASFKSGTKILVQKFDLASYEGKPAYLRPYACKPEPVGGFGDLVVTRGCYLVKDFGTATHMFNAEMCDELTNKGVLESVKCRKITFHPDGRFIQLPWHADISDKPEDDKKDSLVLAVGKCSRFSD